MLGLATPVWLAALAAVGIPLLIHLLTRRRTVRRVFPALALLSGLEAGRSQRRRWRDIIVLLLRVAAIACLALALSSPIWYGSFIGSEQRPAVVILDASASMQQSAQGTSSWERARAAAGHFLDRLEGRPLTVLIAGDTVLSSGDTVADLRPGRVLLAEAKVSYGPGSLGEAMSRALEVLPQGGDCFIFTDLARSSLSHIDPNALPEHISLELIDAGGGGDNIGIISIGSEPGVAIAGRPLQLQVRVANYTKATQNVGLNIALGGEHHLVDVELAPGRIQTVSHELTPESSGAIPVTASISAANDQLSLDDERDAVLQVIPALQTVLASDADSRDPAGTVKSLAAALHAVGLPSNLSDGRGIADLDAKTDLLVSSGLAGLDATSHKALLSWMQNGGTWLQVIQSTGDVSAGPDGIDAPMQLGERIDVSQQERGQMSIAQVRLDHPLLESFNGRENLLTQIGAYRYHMTPAGQAADATVIATYADGSIAWAERPVGQGRWLCLNCSTAAADSNLAAGEALPLLITHLPELLVPGKQKDLASAVAAPINSAATHNGPQGLSVAAIDGLVRLPRPGIWRSSEGQVIAAAVPGLESDLRQLDPSRLGITAVTAKDALADSQAYPLWPWLVLLGLGLLLIEQLVAGGIGRLPQKPVAAEVTA